MASSVWPSSARVWSFSTFSWPSSISRQCGHHSPGLHWCLPFAFLVEDPIEPDVSIWLAFTAPVLTHLIVYCRKQASALVDWWKPFPAYVGEKHFKGSCKSESFCVRDCPLTDVLPLLQSECCPHIFCRVLKDIACTVLHINSDHRPYFCLYSKCLTSGMFNQLTISF